MCRVFLLLLAPVLVAAETPGDLLRQAQDSLGHGRYAAARDDAQRAAIAFQSAGDSPNRARALTVAGLADMYSGRYQSALNNFEDALQVARAVNDFGNEIGRLNDIGNAYYFQGLYSQAMTRYQQALHRVEETPSDRWSSWARQITTANIAILYQTLGQFDRALELFSQLLQGAHSLPPQEQAQLLSNVGVLRRRLGDPHKALDTYRQAQQLYRNAAHRDGEIAVLNNIGIVQAMDLGDLRAAEETFTQALRLAESSGALPLAVHSLLYRAEAYYREGKLSQSEVDFQAAAGQARKLGGREEEWKALYGMARIASRTGRKVDASTLLESAITLIESLRTNAGTPSSLSGFLADKRAVYDLRIENSSTASEAFPWIEQSRARTLQDRLAAPRKTLSDLAATLPDDTAILEFWTAAESSAVIWISRQSSGMRRWTTTTPEREALSEIPRILSDPSRRDWHKAIRPLASLLTGIPVLHDQRIRRLFIVPDGALATIPFEALPFADRELLIQRFEISYAPYATYISRDRVAPHWRWPWQLVVAGFADPAPSSGPDKAGVAPSRSWPGLPQAARELNGIAAISGGRSLLHIGGAAQKQWIAQAAAAPVVHFATHASANPQNADLSYMVLAPAQGGAQQFDYLFLKEVYTLPFSKVDLVTLSACETDTGKIVPGEGEQGFSQAFLSAGAHSVVASLWKVDDKAAAEFMLRFYRKLWAGQPLAQALRETKIEFLSQDVSSHPAYWAAFVANGDAGLRLPRVVRWSWITSIAALLVAAAVWLRTKARKA